MVYFHWAFVICKNVNANITENIYYNASIRSFQE